MWIKRVVLTGLIGLMVSAGVVSAQDPTEDGHEHEVDLQNLPLGDDKVSTSPQRGFLWACRVDSGGGGAFQDGPWINAEAGTWDATAKITVDGAILWQNYTFSIEIVGDKRVITGNGLPPHATGIYPVQTSDDAYQYDRNPNSIQQQTITLELPLNPTLAAAPSCAPGEIGIAITGIPIFNALDAEGRDAVAHEIQDECDGHPQISGQYHYHNLSSCIEELDLDADTSSHSPLIGYAFDGFGIFGYRGENGELMTNETLDECHGHTHVIEWDGQQVEMYHYHATAEFPYTVGCMRGTPVMFHSGGMQQGGQQGQPPQGGQQGQPPQGGQGQPPQGGQGQPPQGGQGQPPQGGQGQPPQGGGTNG